MLVLTDDGDPVPRHVVIFLNKKNGMVKIAEARNEAPLTMRSYKTALARSIWNDFVKRGYVVTRTSDKYDRCHLKCISMTV